MKKERKTRVTKKDIEIYKEKCETKEETFSADLICPGCGKPVLNGYGHIVVGRWHLCQRFHAKPTCIVGIEDWINKIVIDKLNENYRGYKLEKDKENEE